MESAAASAAEAQVGRSRYIIGVDLGTTNTVVAAVDTRAAGARVELCRLAQLVAAGTLDERPQLPSFVYLPGPELSSGQTALPWDGAATRVVGELARNQGALQPARTIASAKSWLCHGGVDRRAAILPWGVHSTQKLSPVEASSLVLGHVRAAWDHAHAGDPEACFIEQELIVTVPASFDEAARELALEAAAKAGLPSVVLLEEPQAAFYAWMNAQPAARLLREGERVLVFDVGGGTTDFTLIAVKEGSRFERTAVGDHLLLGGDNVDLALTRRLEGRIASGPDGAKLETLAWHELVHACRLAKETLLADESLERIPVTVSGRGGRLIGGTLREELSRGELEEILFEGFFPRVGPTDFARRSRSGLHEFGLPYAADAAITRHLAVFLARHGSPRVDAVLFNGGTMTPPALRRRLLAQLEHWQPEAGAPRELVARAPELAVAEGAAYYGLVRRGLGTRIGGGTARSFYAGVGAVEGRETAVCLAPMGLVEGQTVELEHDFRLLTNRPVSFKLYSSTAREDAAGAVIALGPSDGEASDDLLELPPIVTAVRAPGRGEVTVRLQVRLTELGALEIWCAEGAGVEGDGSAEAPRGRWRLAFDMRSGGAKLDGDDQPALAAAAHLGLAEAREQLAALFDGPPEGLARLMKLLEERLGPRDEWATATARGLFDAALELEPQRKRSASHEARWLHLVGFCLRPGAGAPLDDWRSKSLWLIYQAGLAHENAEQCRLAWWITWRRIAGGLSKGQQDQIWLPLSPLFVPGPQSKRKWYQLKPSREEQGEMLRCLANLERLAPSAKVALGDQLVARLESKKERADGINLWALARLGARMPLYGPLDAVVPADRGAAWLRAILEHAWPDSLKIAFSIAQLARRTGDRSRDLDDQVRARVLAWLEAAGATRAATLVADVVALEAREQQVAFGDTLPPGLRLA
jgi:molecular chaperone DnaK (HSP70)